MRTRLLVVGLAAVLGLAACGTGDETTTTTDTVTPGATPTPTPTDGATPDAAATPDATEGTEAAGTDAATEVAPIASAVDATLAEGSATFEAVTEIDSPDFSDRFQSSGVVDFAGEQRQIDIGTEAGSVQTLVREDGVLVSLGEATGWVRVDPRQLEGTPLEAFGFATLPLQDPSVNLALLRGATEEVQEVGEEEIGGETTTHWVVTVDVDEAAAQAGPDTRAMLEQAAGSGGTVELDVWVDEQDRIRRIQNETDLAETQLVTVDPGAEGTIEVTIDFDDFGTAPDISEPDEGQIVDVDEQTLEQLLQQVGG